MRALTYTETLSTTGANGTPLIFGITGAIIGSGVAARFSALPAFLIFLKAYEIKRNPHLGWAAASAVAYFTANTVIGIAIGGELGMMLGRCLDNADSKEANVIGKATNATDVF